MRLTRSIDVPEGTDVRFWSWNDYTIEELWDYGFIEVSTDSGANWTQLEVRDEADTIVGTAEDDAVQSFAGDDSVSGGEGDDWIWTGYGSDTVSADAGDAIEARTRPA